MGGKGGRGQSQPSFYGQRTEEHEFPGSTQGSYQHYAAPMGGPDPGAAWEAYYAQQQAAMEEQIRQQAVEQIDQYLTNRESAYTSAMEEINDQVAGEYARGNLYGIDYQIGDDVLQERINFRFGDYWPESNDEAMAEMFGQYATEGQREQLASRVRMERPEGTQDAGSASTPPAASPQAQAPRDTTLTEGVLGTSDEERKTLSAILGGY